ncbi:MAG: AAA family ATPase [Gammaproteobacteria bacterium]
MLPQRDTEILRNLDLIGEETELAIEYSYEPTGEPPDRERKANRQSPFPHTSLKSEETFKTVAFANARFHDDKSAGFVDDVSDGRTRFHYPRFIKHAREVVIPFLANVVQKHCKIVFWDGAKFVPYDAHKDPFGFEFLYHSLEMYRSAIPKSYDIQQSTFWDSAISQGLTADKIIIPTPYFFKLMAEQGYKDTISRIDIDTVVPEAQARSLIIRSRSLRMPDLPEFRKLHTLILECKYQKNALAFLKASPNLISLEIDKLSYLDPDLPIPELNHLETLSIANGKISLQFFLRLLTACPKLKNLSIDNMQIVSDVKDAKFPYLPDYRLLFYTNSSLTDSSKPLWINSNVKLIKFDFDSQLNELLHPKDLSGIQHFCGTGRENENVISMLEKLPRDLLTCQLEVDELYLDDFEETAEQFELRRRTDVFVQHMYARTQKMLERIKAIQKTSNPSTPPQVKPKALTGTARPALSDVKLDSETELDRDLDIASVLLFKTKDPALDDPRLYRLKVFNTLSSDIEPGTEYNWEIYPETEYRISNDLETRFDTKITDKNIAFSTIELTPTPGKQILHSLSINEKLTEIEIISDDPKAKVVIHRDPKIHLYAAEIQASSPVRLNYLLQVNRDLYDGTQILDKDIKEILDKSRQFVPGKLNLDALIAESKTAESLPKSELLAEIKKQGLGSCRHRSFVSFKEQLAIEKEKGYLANLSAGYRHLFVETILPDGHGLTVDLGGAGEIRSSVKLAFDSRRKIKSAVVIPEKKETLPEFDPAEFKKYECPFPSFTYRTLSDFFAKVLSIARKPYLLNAENESKLHGMAIGCAKYCKEAKIEFCYIDDLNDLKNTETQAFIKKVKEFSDKEAVLLVRWDKYKTPKPEHVGLNSLFDIPPKLEGNVLPANLKILALKEDSTTLSEDVRSRFQKRTIACLRSIDVPNGNREKKFSERDEEQKAEETVNLYTSPEWEKLLIGQTIYQNGQSQFVPGKLLSMVDPESKQESAKELCVLNPPWKYPPFKAFWNRIQTERRFFANGKFYDLPADFSLIWAEKPFVPPADVKIVRLNSKNVHEWQYPLNQKTRKRFLSTLISRGKKTEIIPGPLLQAKDSKITALLSEKITDGQKEEIYDKAKEINCELSIIDATLNIDLDEPIIFERKDSPVTIMTSNDPDFVAKVHADHVVITVSPDTTYNLIEHWVEIEEKGEIDYDNEEGYILKLLREGKNVTLTGHFSENLTKRLETLLANPPYLYHNGNQLEFGADKQLKGKLLIVSDKKLFPFVQVKHVEVKPEEYWDHVAEEDKSKKAFITQLCQELDIKIQYFSQLQSILDNIKSHSDKNPVEWLLLLKENPEEALLKATTCFPRLAKLYELEFKKENTESEGLLEYFKFILDILPLSKSTVTEAKYSRKTAIEMQVNSSALDELTPRLNEMHDRLQKIPFLFLIGPASSGKSTTIIRELPEFYKKQDKDVRIFVTTPPVIDDVIEWANCRDGGDQTMKFLFIDEANLAAMGLFTFVNGMRKIPPEITYNGETIQLTPNHKIIFAGNYQYYEDRRLHKLFLQQDCVQHFPAFSPEFINRTQILPPLELIKKEIGVDAVRSVLEAFLKYREQTMEVNKKALLTTRNLQSMVLDFILLQRDRTLLPNVDKSARIDLLVKWAFYQNARDVLPDNQAAILKSHLFEGQYDILKKQFYRVKRMEVDEILISSVHKRAAAVLRAEMQMIELRNQLETERGFSCGTRGILLAGIPGIGKSGIATSYLKMLGYRCCDASADVKDDGAKKYYHITTTNPQAAKQILLKAFHEGVPVIVDEINTLPLESLMNSLMMGFDNKGRRAEKKGFYLIGTYNQYGYGRRKLSPAFENRFRKIQMPDFTKVDLDKFLAMKFKVVPQRVRDYFCFKYQNAKITGNPYNFRELLEDMKYAHTVVSDEISAEALIKSKSIQSTIITPPETVTVSLSLQN